MAQHPTRSYVLVFCVFVALATLYSLVTPVWEAPDELAHFDYVTHLLKRRELPVMKVGKLGEFHQPPVYYALAALATQPADLSDATGKYQPNKRFMWASKRGKEVNISLHDTTEHYPFRGHALALRLARAVSVVLGLLTVLLTLNIGAQLFPGNPWPGLLAAALVALNPQFLFISGALNNDNLLILAATGTWNQLLRTLRRGEQRRQWVYLGLWLALALLAKVNGVFVVGAAVGALGLAWLVWRPKGLGLANLVLLGLVVTVASGWWFGRNWSLYGDPLAWGMYQRLGYDDLRVAPLQWADVQQFLTTQFRSYWGVFGWMTLFPPAAFYTAIAGLCALALAGLAVFARRDWPRLLPAQQMGLLVLGTVVLLQEAALFALVTRCDNSCYQGRYLFPVIAPLALLLSVGLLALAPRRLAPAVVGAVGGALLVTAVYVAVGVIQPAYPFRSVPMESVSAPPSAPAPSAPVSEVSLAPPDER